MKRKKPLRRSPKKPLVTVTVRVALRNRTMKHQKFCYTSNLLPSYTLRFLTTKYYYYICNEKLRKIHMLSHSEASRGWEEARKKMSTCWSTPDFGRP